MLLDHNIIKYNTIIQLDTFTQLKKNSLDYLNFYNCHRESFVIDNNRL